MMDSFLANKIKGPKEKSAMLKWDEPGFMDGVRCRPITASKKSKKSAVVGARACLSRGLITCRHTGKSGE
jgi:hypothetical protein